MRKLTAYTGNAFDFYKEVVSAKRNSPRDTGYTTRISAMEGLIKPLFEEYDTQFTANNLVRLRPRVFTAAQKADLLKLYVYKSKRLQKLKVQLTTSDLNKVINTCQCCTIGEVGSFDHLVPKDEFPEFCVNPKNLFPCCHSCNQYKNVGWRNGTVRTFLNLFLDDLPASQYLFAAVSTDAAGIVTANYSLRNTSRINAAQFALLSSHYTNLHLFTRFKQGTDEAVTPLINSIKSGRTQGLTLVQVREQLRATSLANQQSFGMNYWKSILELALSDNAAFMNFSYYNA